VYDDVWITGVGVGTPLGYTFDEAADALLAGRSGVRAITAFDTSRHRCKIMASLDPTPVPPSRVGDESFARLGIIEQLTLWCAEQALRDAGWWEQRDSPRLGLILGLGAEWLCCWERDGAAGGNRVHDPRPDQDSQLKAARRELGITGPSLTAAAACASANYGLGLARRWVASGMVDACLVGASDRSVTPISLAGFGNLGALTSRNATPETASRPFDRGRDGFVMGEGGALFVLERASQARRRGARVYAELAGVGASSDAHHMVTPCPDPTQLIRAVRAALAEARVAPAAVDYINAHATSTPLGDIAESRGLRTVLGDAVRRVAVSSTKSMTGHLISAAAAFEAFACVTALERQAVPPTINLDDPDPECDLCHVAHEAQPRPVRVVVSNSFGFGGSNSCVVLRKVA
jgi:3-oxoacyl-[acyl-carrier-protein] synthase II